MLVAAGLTSTLLWVAVAQGAGPSSIHFLKDIRPGSSWSSPQQLTDVNGTLFFSASDAVSGAELWKSDGAPEGTVWVKDIRVGGSGSSMNNLTAVGATLFFRANDGVNGDEVWKSDGTHCRHGDAQGHQAWRRRLEPR